MSDGTEDLVAAYERQKAAIDEILEGEHSMTDHKTTTDRAPKLEGRTLRDGVRLVRIFRELQWKLDEVSETCDRVAFRLETHRTMKSADEDFKYERDMLKDGYTATGKCAKLLTQLLDIVEGKPTAEDLDPVHLLEGRCGALEALLRSNGIDFGARDKGAT